VQAFTHEAIDCARFGTRVETAFAVARRRIAVRAVLTGLVILLAFGAITLVLWSRSSSEGHENAEPSSYQIRPASTSRPPETSRPLQAK